MGSRQLVLKEGISQRKIGAYSFAQLARSSYHTDAFVCYVDFSPFHPL
jgi:hypothetical protein